MENNPTAKLLRIFLGESDKYHQQPLYEAIVFEAKKQSLSGATVTRELWGLGPTAEFILPNFLIFLQTCP
jgi:uncharacterized protein